MGKLMQDQIDAQLKDDDWADGRSSQSDVEGNMKIVFTVAGIEQEFDMPEEWWRQVVALLDHTALAGPREFDIAARMSKAITWCLPGGPFERDETKKARLA